MCNRLIDVGSETELVFYLKLVFVRIAHCITPGRSHSNYSHWQLTDGKCSLLSVMYFRQPASTVLHPLLAGIYELATPVNGQREDVDMESARASLVALNIVTQKQLKVRIVVRYFDCNSFWVRIRIVYVKRFLIENLFIYLFPCCRC